VYRQDARSTRKFRANKERARAHEQVLFCWRKHGNHRHYNYAFSKMLKLRKQVLETKTSYYFYHNVTWLEKEYNKVSLVSNSALKTCGHILHSHSDLKDPNLLGVKNFSSSSFVIRVNLLHPQPSFFLYRLLSSLFLSFFFLYEAKITQNTVTKPLSWQ